MPKIKTRIIFTRCIQDAEGYGSDDEDMVSRVFFELEMSGKRYPGLFADIKHPVISEFEKMPLKVGRPQGYGGPLNYNAFCQAAEVYYRECVEDQGMGIHFAGCNYIRIRDKTYTKTKIVEFERDTDTGVGDVID